MEQTGAEPDRPEPVFLDFSDVNVATASFLRETVFAFRDTVRHRRSNLYPVVANASELVVGGLKVLVEQQGDVLMLCTLDKRGRPKEPYLLGDLDPKQRITFDLVREQVRKLSQTPEFATARRARNKIEALFSELRNQIRLRKVRLRGLRNAKEQFVLAAL